MPTITRKAAPSQRTNAAVNTRASASTAASAAQCCCPACTGLQCLDRTRFFAGQLLTEADLNNEQSYLLAKNRLHNRYLHGWGVVCGLQVVCGECDGWVTVKTGYALDPCGNDIIVCADQPFNVLKAIQACCAPSTTTSNCSPLRSPPPPTCQDTIQHWCITIQYQEQASRLVTALQQTQAKTSSCGCGCGGSGGCGCGGHGNGGGGCGCGGNGSKSKSATQTSTTTTAPAGACEATRILEGFQLGVCSEQPQLQTKNNPYLPQPGTARYQLLQCITAVEQIILQAPDFSTVGTWTAQTAYQAACKYLVTVRNFLSQSDLINCAILDTISAITVNPIGPNQPLDQYVNSLAATITQLNTELAVSALDCLCLDLLPPCPPDPCDNRVCLACVSIQNGKIINICNFGCRRQVVTFPSLYYWLSLFGFDRVLTLLTTGLQRLCCGQRDQFVTGIGDFNARENFTTAGFSNSAMMNRMMEVFLSQNLGATIVNAGNPQAAAVDLRPLIGLSAKESIVQLERQYGIQNVTPVPVDADPAWTDDAVTAASQFAPAAFSRQSPLTVYTKGDLIVGFDVTNPTDVLARQVADLQQQISNLQQQFSSRRKG